ncbi:uncharacterized protein LAJ45_09835 [Morchella importuna]|uniref:uncharacterized protein n=1 Tax=Morchella importuna TaxID=1174673 RepID=UPI001E8D8698|nr:uncharacterized protein LAJ45_09835 [Morchella importuna]KAH8146145.1 hypothetical protein LAJ45_09835 [Morchella importuna]
MSSTSLTSHPNTGIVPTRDSLEINIAITPVRRTRRPVAVSPGSENMPISEINTPQRSALARNNPYNHFLYPSDGTDPASPINAAASIDAAASNTGVTTIITGGTATATTTGTTSAAALGLADSIKQGIKDLIKSPIEAMKRQTKNWKREATATQKTNIAENKRQREVDAAPANSITKGSGGDDVATQATMQAAHGAIADQPAGNQLGESSSPATATTATANVPAASAVDTTTGTVNNTNFRSILDIDLYAKVKAAMAKRRWSANHKRFEKTMAKRGAASNGGKCTSNNQKEPKRPHTA